MADPARRITDAKLREMEAHIAEIYQQSLDELTEKWNQYMDRTQARLADLYAAYLGAPADMKAEALREYQDAMQRYTLQNKWYKDMVTETTFRLANVNQIAMSYINDQIPSIYVTNFNQIDPDALIVRSNWTLRNEHTVKALIEDTLPGKTVNYGKDMRWNTRQINSSVLQGILQGESIPKISDRLLPIVDNNRVSATRTARTMVTRAENRGRLDRYQEYEESGLVMAKVWIATPDFRVRDWHLSMDGQEVDVNEPFIDGHGEELMYPGDPDGSPRTVYNCRCTMRSHILGVKDRSGKMVPMKEYSHAGNNHAQRIEAERERREAEEYG